MYCHTKIEYSWLRIKGNSSICGSPGNTKCTNSSHNSTNHDFVNHYTRRIEFSDSQSIEVRDALAAEAMNIEQVMEIPEEPHLYAVPIPAVFDLNYIINDAVSDVNNELLQLYASIPSNAELSISELDDLFNFDTTQFDWFNGFGAFLQLLSTFVWT